MHCMYFLVSDDESEHENEEEEWEAQQIRKGVTGAQVTFVLKKLCSMHYYIYNINKNV